MWFSNKDKFEYIVSIMKYAIDEIWLLASFKKIYETSEANDVFDNIEKISNIIEENKTIAGVYNGIKELNLGANLNDY